MTSGLKLHHAVIAALIMFAASLTSKAEHVNEKSFAHSIDIASKPEVVWEALTMKRHVDQYYLAPIGQDIRSAESEIYYGTADNKMIVGEVAIFDPPMRLMHTFRFEGREGAKTSYVTYWIRPTKTGSKLTVSHVGYKANSQEFKDVSMGWPIIMDRLKAHIEK